MIVHIFTSERTSVARGRGRGNTQIWFGWGYATLALKPLPTFKGLFGRKNVPVFRDFYQNIHVGIFS